MCYLINSVVKLRKEYRGRQTFPISQVIEKQEDTFNIENRFKIIKHMYINIYT